MQARCTELGRAYHEQVIRENQSEAFPVTFPRPSFAYNEEKNTCLYEGTITHPSDGTEEMFLIDLLRNERIVRYSVPVGAKTEQQQEAVYRYSNYKQRYWPESPWPLPGTLPPRP
jgi:hypothetical protein